MFEEELEQLAVHLCAFFLFLQNIIVLQLYMYLILYF